MLHDMQLIKFSYRFYGGVVYEQQKTFEGLYGHFPTLPPEAEARTYDSTNVNKADL
jgi:hypothetical protein